LHRFCLCYIRHFRQGSVPVDLLQRSRVQAPRLRDGHARVSADRTEGQQHSRTQAQPSQEGVHRIARPQNKETGDAVVLISV